MKKYEVKLSSYINVPEPLGFHGYKLNSIINVHAENKSKARAIAINIIHNGMIGVFANPASGIFNFVSITEVKDFS